MNAKRTEELFLIVLGICMFATVLAKPLGIPDDWQIAIDVLLFGCLLGILNVRRKKRESVRAGSIPPPVAAPLAARKRVFWIVTAALIAGSVGMLPLMPYTVENFQPWIYLYVVPFQCLFVGGFLWFYWHKLVAQR